MLVRLAGFWMVVAALAGCSKDPFQTAPVSGVVTLDGKPIAQVAVMFQPVAADGNMNPGPGSFGVTDEQGRYHLQIVGEENKKGGVVGKNKVRFDPHSTEKPDPSSDAPFRPKQPLPKIPSKYNRVDAFFEFDVPPKGTTTANFDLVSK